MFCYDTKLTQKDQLITGTQDIKRAAKKGIPIRMNNEWRPGGKTVNLQSDIVCGVYVVIKPIKIVLTISSHFGHIRRLIRTDGNGTG